MSDTEKVKVVVRVRPFNRREIELGTKCVVDMEPQQTMLYHPSVGISGADTPSGHVGSTKKQPKVFAFDHCFYSMEENNPKFSSQEHVFSCLGKDLLRHAFGGYNCCIFAYGQTGSGKSYTMMGTSDQKGIIPRLCEGLFESITDTSDLSTSFKVEVSYMEIYNEKVRDLLDPKGGKHTLRVREHNILGPYVDELSTLAVSTFKDINALMSEGNKSRTVAATNMNSESSRSHAVFNIILTQTLTDLATGVSGEKVSKMSLVDLAGSERAQKTGAVGERLKEGSNINKSLTTLGLVISALADQASGKSRGKFVPYRDSVLTWLLKDNLGGNSKTVMIATLSPAADNYEETLSTLRYADRAKRIVNHAVVNEDPNARIIRELREEVDMLKLLLNEAQSMKAPDLRERLEESEKLMKDMSKTWEQKLIETERIHQERHAALEKMGISVQTSGIKVEQGKYYLVNLNADPSLNELLVYYLKDHTMVGRPNAPSEQDIQLSGLGIVPEHCIVDIENNDVFLSPLDGARTCVNGRTITSKTRVKHGDRILWGNNHFFRINCPKANSPSAETPEQNIDYDFAQQELMMQEMGDDPIQDAIEAMEKQHEEEKAEALEKQRQMYERQMQMLRSQLMSPSTPSQPYPPFFDPFTKMTTPGSTNSNMHPKYQQWAQEREKLFKASLSKLKEEVVRANALVREANFLAQEMGKETEFFVTLQIPAGNLSPNRKRGAFVSEPAILVKQRHKGSQIWSMDKFENKIFDMREMYEERKEKGLPMMDEGPPAKGDPFYESQENHNLIGVANIFLEALFYDVKLNYHVPIISQQGEVAGRLHIELSRLASTLPDRNINLDSLNSEDLETIGDEENGVAIGSVVACRVCIKEARGLPPALSNFVFCQYAFWGHPEPIVIPPQVNADVNGLSKKRNDSMSFIFDHSNEFTVHVTEEFMEHCTEGALSIEVWGHRSIGFGQNLPGWEIDPVVAKSRSIMDRWSELTRKIEMWVEVHEINDQGEYMPVEVNTKAEVLTGGVVQLRQGHSRRILVQAKPVQNSGTLPIICESITHVSIGCVCARSKLQKGLDSYQEEDLTVLREKWSNALNKRREYLDEQLQRTMNKEDKTDTDKDREKSLIDQWVCLTEERNAVLVPAAGSGIPGAPADWEPQAGMEQHIPVIFLDLNAEDMSTPQVKEGMQAAGVNSILPKEHGAKFYTLPFVKNSEKDVTAVVSWDSSIHDSVHLNRITPNNERVYLILKVVVRLSHPASMELVLRKRICINVYKRQSLTDKLKKRIGKSDSVYASGVTYEVVSNIPKASEDLEDRESLAQMAASTHEINTSDGETYIEKYIRGVSAVESILTLDRLRQEVTIKELLAARGRPLRKSTSVPNIHNIMTSPRGLDEQMRTDSLQDLSYGGGDRFPSLPKQFPFDFRHRGGSEDLAKELIYGKEGALLPNKPTGPFSLARPTFLNLRTNIYNSVTKPSPKAGASPQPTKLVKPMKTLVEEQHIRETKPLLNRTDTEDSDDDEFAKLKSSPSKKATQQPAQITDTTYDSDDFTEFESYQENQNSQFPLTAADGANTRTDSMTHSSTNESLTDIQAAKSFTPSMSSSGYGSQAVSTQTLSSEDSASVRSMSIDDTPDQEVTKDRRPVKPTTLDVETARDLTPEKDALRDEPEKEHTPPNKPLKTSLSLIDMDVPSNLGTPLQPSSPQESEEEGDNKITNINGHHAPEELQGEKETQSEMIENVSEKEESVGVEEGVNDENSEAKNNKCEDESSEEEIVVSKQSDGNVDLYSENAMDELEALAETEVNVTVEVFKPAAPPAIARAPTETKMDANANPTEEQQESRDKFEETPRRGSADDKVVRRRSWHEKLERRANTVDESSSAAAPSKTEVKLRKGGSIDVSRPSSLKKLRSGEQKAGKGTPSPVKATYRPMSMPVDHLVGALEEDLDNSMEVDDNSDNDDGMSICSFGSRADLHRLGEAPIPSWVQPGEPVIVLSSRGGASKTGSVQFVGTTEFASGNWVGVALDTADGKNDGSVKGIRYFKCRQRHGIFVRHDKLIMDKKRKGTKMRNVSPSLRRSTGNLSSHSPHKDTGSFMKGTAASYAKHK